MRKVTVDELAFAYRKIKDFLYRQRSQARILKLYNFERDLFNNLKEICRKLNDGDYSSFVEKCEGAHMVPSRQESKNISSGDYVHVRSQDVLGSGSTRMNEVYFRLLSDIPIECEVVFCLWIMRTGHLVESLLGNGEKIVGDKLYRIEGGDFPNESPFLYKEYWQEYASWQRTVSDEIKELLEKQINLMVFVTELRDATVFSKIEHFTPETLLCENHHDKDPDLTDLIARMLNNWRDHEVKYTNSLPGGLSLTRLISNMQLTKLDAAIQKDFKLLHYSRCGKAIALIVENNTTSANKFYEKVSKTVTSTLLKPKDLKGGILFHKSKTRILELSSGSGRTLLKSFDKCLEDGAKEWRTAPELPESVDWIRRMSSPFANTGEACDLLHIDQSMLSRRRFVKQIQNMETFLINLDLKDWEERRVEFLSTIYDSFLDFRSFVMYYSLYPRIFAIAFASSVGLKSCEYVYACKMLDKIRNYIDEIDAPKASNRSKCVPEGFRNRLKSSFGKSIIENLCATVISCNLRDGMLMHLKTHYPDIFGDWCNLNELPSYRDLQNRDLANISFIDCVLHNYWRGYPLNIGDVPIYSIDSNYNLIPAPIVHMLCRVSKHCLSGIKDETCPFAFYFATRPLDVSDLYTINGIPTSINDAKNYKLLLRYLSGIGTSCVLPVAGRRKIMVESRYMSEKVRIALVSWRVDMKSWVAMACGCKDPLRRDRYTRLMKIVNHIVELPSESLPHYVLFPELALPPELFMRISKKLAYRGISLIAGVDYILHGKNERGERVIKDQVWCSLCFDGARKKPIIIRFTKTMPAQHEEDLLYKMAHAVYAPDSAGSKPFVICHGNKDNNVYFSVLICSDILNIATRSELRGKIDLLFVSAWNQDIGTYSALVEASAYDIHTYVALSNSRAFGDTRLRSPAKERYERDIVRLQGGINDYFVIGEVDVKALRQFQSAYRSPGGSFKPTPTGFLISKPRRSLPGVE